MLKKLNLTGTAKEIGLNHGLVGKKEVLRSLETYETLFYEYSQIRWREARELALKHLKAISKYDPDLIEEMEGVAIGAGVDFEDIFALNARSEIALSGKYTKFADGCTAIGVMEPIAEDVIIGQNWDWKTTQADSLLYLEINQHEKPSIKMVTEGGIIGKIGYNSSDIGVCLNALLTDKKSDQIPIHLGLRSVLNSFTYQEAILKIDKGQMASTANFLIGCIDKQSGFVINAEVSPIGVSIEENSRGYVVHTNHICSPFIISQIMDRNDRIEEDSMERMKRAKQLVEYQIIQNKKVNEENFKEWFSDKHNYPDSINSFVNEEVPSHRKMETIFSIIMNLSARKMLLCVGKPSEAAYSEIK